MLNALKDEFKEEVRVLNNLGIISKRQGNVSESEAVFA